MASYGFANNFINDAEDFHDACNLLDSGVSECKQNRASYLTIGITEIAGITAISQGFTNGYVTFQNIFTIRLDDDSTVTIVLQCIIVDGVHEYEVISYT